MNAVTPIPASPPTAISKWYVEPLPTPPRGWLVYSEDFILRVLQGKYGRPEQVRRTPVWMAIARALQFAIGVVQATLLVLSSIPVLHLSVEFFVTNFARGSLGTLLRACYWKARLGYLGQDVIIDRGVNIWGASAVMIGSCVHLDSDVRIGAGEGGQSQGGRIEIGDYTHIGPRCNIAARGGVVIGQCVSVQALVHIYSATTTAILPDHPGQLPSLAHMAPHHLQNVAAATVWIGDYASIGFASLILPGAHIGAAAIVHPYSQVSGRFEACANIAGPGRAKQNGWRLPPKIDPRLASGRQT